MRLHVLGVPHTISIPEYSACAFTQKVVKFCKMMHAEGHHVIHYGNEASKVDCAEHVTVTTHEDLLASYPGHDWRTQGWPAFNRSDRAYMAFYANAIGAIQDRKQPGDILCITFGDWHRPIAEALPDIAHVETGIGYPNGVFAPYRVYESYAIMHAYQGNEAALHSSNSFWYDTVIPNAFNLDEFQYMPNYRKEDYLLFLGRIGEGKGIHIAKQIAEATKTKLKVAGTGEWEKSPYVEYVGVAGPAKRNELMRKAKATICASTYLEPFCGVQIESMLCGTPVISTDWGAFAEYNVHGVTGYRCKTFEQFVWAAKHTEVLRSDDCRSHAEHFSLEEIAPYYTDYLSSVRDIVTGKGWYEPREDRLTLGTASYEPLRDRNRPLR